MEFDTEFIGRSSEGDTPGGGRAWEGGAAEKNIRTQTRFYHGVAQRGEALSTIDALVRKGAMQRSTAAERLTGRRLLTMLNMKRNVCVRLKKSLLQFLFVSTG